MYDKIKCLECNREFGAITSQHLKKCCGLTLRQYKDKHPEAETISEKVNDVRKQNCMNMIGKTKIVKCSKCGKDMETATVNHWDFICKECRKLKTYEGQIYIEDKDLIVCQVCWVGLEQMSWMHLNLHNLTMKKYREKFPNALVTNKGIRKERSERHTGENNPTKRPEVREILSEAQRLSSKKYTEKYPWIFPKIEQIRDTFGHAEVLCKKCKKWFSPTPNQLQERIRALNHGSDGCYLYCSDECKGECSLYRLNPSQFLSAFKGKRLYTDQEYEVFRQEVLKRQRDHYGSNFCELCEGTKKLQVHHEKPKKTHPGMVLDPDNGIILCEDCHMKKIHVGECSRARLANIC
jgi:hypothetical protein